MSLSELILLALNQQTLVYVLYTNYSYNSTVILSAAFSKLIYFLIMQFLLRFSGIKKEKKIPLSFGSFLLNLIPVMSTGIFFTFSVICLIQPLPSFLNLLISISAILLLNINVLIFWLNKQTQEKTYEYTQLQIQLQKEFDMAQYYKLLLKQDENQKILIHDIKKHLQSIDTLNTQGQQEKISYYIEHLIQSSDLQESVHVCDNEMLNAILSRYIQSCKEKNISLRADIRKGLLPFMTYNDLTALFCNLLDNSIESCIHIPQGYIELSVTYDSNANLTVITLINSCHKNPFLPHSKRLISHKKEPLRHGFGIKSIERVVEKYNGNMNMYYDETTMNFHAIITLKSENTRPPLL
jgi:hypothetical protein